MWGRPAQLSLAPKKLQGFTKDKKANWCSVILFVECSHSNAGHVKKKSKKRMPDTCVHKTCVHKAEKISSKDLENILIVNKIHLLFAMQKEMC